MRSGGYDHDPECRDFNATTNALHFDERQRDLYRANPRPREPLYTQQQVAAEVAAERLRCANVAANWNTGSTIGVEISQEIMLGMPGPMEEKQ